MQCVIVVYQPNVMNVKTVRRSLKNRTDRFDLDSASWSGRFASKVSMPELDIRLIKADFVIGFANL